MACILPQPHQREVLLGAPADAQQAIGLQQRCALEQQHKVLGSWRAGKHAWATAQQGRDVLQQRDQDAPGRPEGLSSSFHLFSDAERDFLSDCLLKEVRARADASYLLTVQPEIDAHKRLMLVDWLVEVVDEFRLSQECLYLAVSLLDRFLSREPVRCCHLQLLGVTCLWVAAKFEEVKPPVCEDFVEITDNTYAAQDLVRMEGIVLTTLGFQLAVPTPLHFLHQLLSHVQLQAHGLERSPSPSPSPSPGASPVSSRSPSASPVSSSSGGGGSSSTSSSPCRPACGPGGHQEAQRLAHLAEYLLELALLTPDTLRYRPSVVAASALQLAAALLSAGGDAAGRAPVGGLCAAIGAAAGEALEGCMVELSRMLRWAGAAQQPPAVRDKYSARRFSYVGRLQVHGCP